MSNEAEQRGALQYTWEEKTGSLVGVNHLLVIGIDSYEHWTPLNNAVRDAKAFRYLLIEAFDFSESRTTSLFNADATKDKILGALRDFEKGGLRPLSHSDNLLIYFAGHGTMNPNKRTGYWIPVDAPTGTRDRHKFLSNEELKESLEQIGAHHIYIVSDACFSGSLITRSGGEELYENKPSRRVLTSGQLEKVLDGPPGGHSPFAEALLSCLREPGEALLSLELEGRVQRQFLNILKRLGHSTDDHQRPVGSHLTGVEDKGGQFVFRPKRDEARAWAEAQAANNVATYRSYLRAYPQGAHAEEASWQVAGLLETADEYGEYLTAWPSGKYLAEAKERQLWLQASADDTVEGWLSYIRHYRLIDHEPENQRVLDALKRVEELAAGTITADPGEVKRLKKRIKELENELDQAQKRKNKIETALNKELEVVREELARSQQGQRQPEATLKVTAGGSADIMTYPNPFDFPAPEVIFIKGGTFEMGSTVKDHESPVRRVTLDDFCLAKYPLTFEEYDAFCEAMGIDKPGDEGWGRGRCPVINVSWRDGLAYCDWLNDQVAGDPVWRLPTEAEWEYAAGGGEKNRTKWAGTDQEMFLGSYACYDGNSIGKTQPVGKKRPNQLGLYDMSGNVWEWCKDWHDKYPDVAQTNPQGPAAGSSRVRRGGGWHDDHDRCRVAYRGSISPSYYSSNIGFRLARIP